MGSVMAKLWADCYALLFIFSATTWCPSSSDMIWVSIPFWPLIFSVVLCWFRNFVPLSSSSNYSLLLSMRRLSPLLLSNTEAFLSHIWALRIPSLFLRAQVPPSPMGSYYTSVDKARQGTFSTCYYLDNGIRVSNSLGNCLAREVMFSMRYTLFSP